MIAFILLNIFASFFMLMAFIILISDYKNKSYSVITDIYPGLSIKINKIILAIYISSSGIIFAVIWS